MQSHEIYDTHNSQLYIFAGKTKKTKHILHMNRTYTKHSLQKHSVRGKSNLLYFKTDKCEIKIKFGNLMIFRKHTS